jgi:short-subunit dehydrogenase
LKQTLEDLNKLPDNITSILWITGNTGDAKKEFTSIEKCKKTIEVNFLNVAIVINFILNNKFLISKSSFVCVFTSVAGLRGRQFNMFYGSAKSALIQYLSGLRQKYNKLINIITVIPGYMLTKSFNTKTYNFLVLSPERSASIIVKAIKKKKEIVYVDYKWKFIMMLIKLIPEKIFKKLKF